MNGLNAFLNAAPETLDASARTVQRLAQRSNINMDPRWSLTFAGYIRDRVRRENSDAQTITSLRRTGQIVAAREAEAELSAHRAITADMRAFLAYEAPYALEAA